MSEVASMYLETHQDQKAVALLEEVLPQIQKYYGGEHCTTLVTTAHLAAGYAAVGRKEDAVQLLEQTLKSMQQALGAEHPETLACMIRLGSAYVEQGKHVEAESLLLAAHEGFAKRVVAYPTPYDRAQAREACRQLVQLYEESGQPEKAKSWKEKLDALKGAAKVESGG